jgi:hypothetical protein
MSAKSQDYEHRLVRYAELILEYLQNNGWRAERSKIKEWILDNNEDISSNFSEKKFGIDFGLACIELKATGFVSFSENAKNEPIVLTPKGIKTDLKELDSWKEIYEASRTHFNKKR